MDHVGSRQARLVENGLESKPKGVAVQVTPIQRVVQETYPGVPPNLESRIDLHDGQSGLTSFFGQNARWPGDKNDFMPAMRQTRKQVACISLSSTPLGSKIH